MQYRFFLPALVLLYSFLWFSTTPLLQAQQATIPTPDEYVEEEQDPVIDMKKLQQAVKYPEIAQRAGVEGKVILRILVGTDGLAKRCEVLSSPSAWLDTAAIAAVMQATFTPGMIKGKPIAVWITLPIVFRLHQPRTLSPIDAIMQAIADRGLFEPYDRALRFYNRGLVYYKSGHRSEAQRDFASAQHIDSTTWWTPYDSIGAKEIARIDIRNNRKVEDALAFAKRGELMMEYSVVHAIADVTLAIDIDPTCIYAYTQRAKAYYLQGTWSQAQSDFLAVQQKQELTPEQNAMLGHCYYEMGEYEKALDVSDEAIEENSELTASYYFIALSLLQMEEEYDDVQAAFEKAKAADGDNLSVRAPFIRILRQLVANGTHAKEAQQILREVFYME